MGATASIDTGNSGGDHSANCAVDSAACNAAHAMMPRR